MEHAPASNAAAIPPHCRKNSTLLPLVSSLPEMPKCPAHIGTLATERRHTKTAWP
jgi:hypothetical protein